ncbi:WcaI family glycosyltransferase [Kordiimonas marina]|uniref:WcaI family glycosyltransferase n=1 Tax=Kordiimonas marina TaxID=2872312 RepID=UPI001FF1E1E0|nr:WcaI family glycosyltransferase [Kordiimonas marina]MCJ9429970.1 WcaI family glycosyltransferase [Kordiimonas marina]
MTDIPKKVLIYGTNYAPEPIGIPRYTTEMAEDIAAGGADVTVIAAAPLYPDWKKRDGYRYGFYSCETLNGVRVIRVPTYAPADTGFKHRILYELVFFIFSLPLLIWFLFSRWQAVIITLPPLILGMATLLPWRKARKVLIVKDLQLDIGQNMGAIRNKTVIGFLAWMERLFFRRADLVTAVSRKMLDRLVEKGAAPSKARLFPDWVDMAHLSPASDADCLAMRGRLGLPEGKTIVGYSGNLARKQGIELVLDVAKDFQDSGRTDVHFIICGGGPAKDQLRQDCEAMALANVTLGDLQPEALLPTLITTMDVHLIPQRNEVSDLVMPGKMFNIMSCQRPLVVTAPAGSSIAEVMETSAAGYAIPREQIGDIIAAVKALCDDSQTREKMGVAGRAYIETEMKKRPVLNTFYKDAGLDNLVR